MNPITIQERREVYLHHPLLAHAFRQVEDRLVDDIVAMYRLKAAGKPVELPERVIINDVSIDLRQLSQITPESS